MSIQTPTPSIIVSAERRHTPRSFALGVAAVASLGLVGGACGSDAVSNTTTDADVVVPVTSVSAAEGVTARATQAAARLSGMEAAGLPAASSMAGDEIAGMCVGEPYVPTAEEIASANADTEALTATLVTYGIAHEVVTDDFGFSYVQTDYTDVVAQSVVDSFWQNRYPVDDVDVDLGDIDMIDIVEPIAPTAEDLAAINADNDKLAAGFDRAGIAYTRVSDDLGWEWIEWDYEDESIRDAVNAVFDEVYPVDISVEPIDGALCDDVVLIDEEIPGDDAAVSGMVDAPPAEAIAEAPPVDPIAETSELRPSDLELVEDEFSAEQVAQRDAEVAAMATGFTSANVEHAVYGESPWASVVFDIENDAAVDVIEAVLAARS